MDSLAVFSQQESVALVLVLALVRSLAKESVDSTRLNLQPLRHTRGRSSDTSPALSATPVVRGQTKRALAVGTVRNDGT